MKFSVCIATYNGEKFIKKQLESILGQISADDEVIISDDSSVDNTIDIIKDFADSRIHLIENCKFKSPVFNFENAILHSQGDVIILSDQDDIWLDNKMETIREYFIPRNCKTDKYTLVMDNYSIDAEGNIIDLSLYKYLDSGKGLLKNFIRNTYLGCNMAFSKSLLDVALPFPKNIPMHDVWLGLISELYGEVYFSPVKTMLFRRHGENATKERYNNVQRLTWRYYLLMGILSNVYNNKFRSK